MWKAVKALPGRIEALETRVGILEAALGKSSVLTGETCPRCGEAALMLTSTSALTGDLAELSAFGGRNEVWTCAKCGGQDARVKLPK